MIPYLQTYTSRIPDLGEYWVFTQMDEMVNSCDKLIVLTQQHVFGIAPLQEI